jgi:hypothetical protein
MWSPHKAVFSLSRTALKSKKINTNTLLKLDLCAERKERPCRHRGGVEEKLHHFLTSVLDGVGVERHGVTSQKCAATGELQ